MFRRFDVIVPFDKPTREQTSRAPEAQALDVGLSEAAAERARAQRRGLELCRRRARMRRCGPRWHSKTGKISEREVVQASRS